MFKIKKILSFIRENDLRVIVTVFKRRLMANFQKKIYTLEISPAESKLNQKPYFKPEKIVFLYDKINAQKGSTILRCHQVYEIIKGGDVILPVEITHNSSTITNSIVIMDKYSSTFATKNDLKKLRRANNILISDPVDDEIFIEKYSQFDGLIASSIKQHAFFTAHLPQTPNTYLFHHADIRLPDSLAPQDKFRAAYFGEPSNMYDFPGLNDWIQPVPVNTSRQKLGWMSSIANYNFHYAVRSKGYSDRIFKPFTKGIIAAHFGANILVHQDDGDAGLYLDDKYPFMLKGELNPKAVNEMLRFAYDSFGGEEWKQGLAAMETLKLKTNLTHLRQEFWLFMKQFL